MPRKTPLVPTHLNSGPWMRKTGHSHALTARLVRCTTRHAPIGEYRSRFFKEESYACRCGVLRETVQHVLYDCPRYGWEDKPNRQLCYAWLVEFLTENEGAFAFDVP